jgi:hypothetical protein
MPRWEINFTVHWEASLISPLRNSSDVDYCYFTTLYQLHGLKQAAVYFKVEEVQQMRNMSIKWDKSTVRVILYRTTGPETNENTIKKHGHYTLYTVIMYCTYTTFGIYFKRL